nr:NADH dehydrogenase subunit 2 [Ammianus toi]
MFKFNKKKLFILIMMLSTIMMMNSTKWLSLWLTMEINLMATTPFIFEKMSKESSEKIMIYFLTQTMASILLLSTILIEMNMNMFNMFMTMSMMIKLGMPPFHMWMPEMLNKLKWDIMLVMITIQKINPLIVISQLMEKNLLFPMIMIFASSVGSISGINQLSLNKIMAFSSINHMSWIMLCMMCKNNLWMSYFLIYSLITLTMCLIFNKKMTFYMNQLNINLNTTMKIMMLLMMLNLGGMPPLPGFFLKWMTLESSMNTQTYFIIIVMLVSSMITLLFYMRTMYNNMMLSSMNIKYKIMYNNMYMYMLFMINMSLPVIMNK